MQVNTEKSAIKSSRKRAAPTKYVSPNQLTLCGFETPFAQQLSKENRWVKMSALIPWDKFLRTNVSPPCILAVDVGVVIDAGVLVK